MTRDELETDLRALPDVREVSVVEDRTLVATVVSGSFAGQDEAERQETVWSLLFHRHRDALHLLQNVEFIFTNAPGTCRARYDEAQWRGLRLTERVGPSDAARFVVGWSPALCVEVRACLKCGNRIARRRAAALPSRTGSGD